MRDDHPFFTLHPAAYLGSHAGRADAGLAARDAEPEPETAPAGRLARLAAARRARREARAAAAAARPDRA
jgi:hypothetical protein